MELVKSQWVADNDRVTLSMPIAKVDRENRLVSGFATLDNIDTSDDVVMAEASRVAFENFRGNIREMHEPIAAGRLVDFREDSFYDKKTSKFYSGIYATAYVSKGAQSTWEKVLDGTLSGFSIGGNITDQETKFVKDAGTDGKSVRFIKSYDLVELSLVDNPANQLSNVDSIVKVFSIGEDSSGEQVMKGMAVDTHLVNVFWCSSDEVAKNSTNTSEVCLNCGSAMTQIGWFEQGDDAVAKTATAVANFLREKEVGSTVEKQANTIANHEGGVDMADKIEKDAEAQTDVVTSGDVADDAEVQTPAEDEVVEEVIEEGADEEGDEGVDEAPVEPDFEKMFDDLKGSVKESIEKTVESVEKRINDATEALNAKASEFEKGLGELREELKAVKETRSEVEKRIDALEKSSAVKKSGEVENSAEPIRKSQKSLWGGAFLGDD